MSVLSRNTNKHKKARKYAHASKQTNKQMIRKIPKSRRHILLSVVLLLSSNWKKIINFFKTKTRCWYSQKIQTWKKVRRSVHRQRNTHTNKWFIKNTHTNTHTETNKHVVHKTRTQTLTIVKQKTNTQFTKNTHTKTLTIVKQTNTQFTKNKHANTMTIVKTKKQASKQTHGSLKTCTQAHIHAQTNTHTFTNKHTDHCLPSTMVWKLQISVCASLRGRKNAKKRQTFTGKTVTTGSATLHSLWQMKGEWNRILLFLSFFSFSCSSSFPSSFFSASAPAPAPPSTLLPPPLLLLPLVFLLSSFFILFYFLLLLNYVAGILITNFILLL